MCARRLDAMDGPRAPQSGAARPGSRSSSASLSASANRPGSADLSFGDESDEPNADQLPGLFETEGLYSFEAESTAELAFSAGQRLRIFLDVPCEPGWWLAELHGRQGLVPCAYTHVPPFSPQSPHPSHVQHGRCAPGRPWQPGHCLALRARRRRRGRCAPGRLPVLPA
jgi:hypothetical protein